MAMRISLIKAKSTHIKITYEKILFAFILLIAVLARFSSLGDRALSHDESIHLYYSYLYSTGEGYAHTPLSHGPFQFHIIALFFSLFGSSDFVGRIPSAISSVLSIVFLWKWRTFLGRAGSIIASCLFIISPIMLYYGRYARNESFVILLSLITLYSVLRYIEIKKTKYLLIFTISTALHFTVKETVFIFTGELLLFLFFLVFYHAVRSTWHLRFCKILFFIFIFLSLVFICLSLISPISSLFFFPNLGTGKTLFFTGLTFFFVASLILVFGFGWKKLKAIPAFDLLILTGTFVLPQLTAFPVTWLGWNPLDYQFSWPGWDLNLIFSQTPPKIGVVFFVLFSLSAVIGLFWGKRNWIIYALLFWGIYIIFYTSFFSNISGFLTGSIGSLGYWLEQQSVHRGNQPFHYYLLILLPLYEYLPTIGLIPAILVSHSQNYFRNSRTVAEITESPFMQSRAITPLFILLLFWWIIASLVAFSAAGEKMPWLTAHIVLPMILLTSWALGIFLDKIITDPTPIKQKIVFNLAIIFVVYSIIRFVFILLGFDLSFQAGQNINLSSTPDLFSYLPGLLIALLLLHYLQQNRIRLGFILNVTVISFFLILGILTIKTGFRASFHNPGNAKEYLVYAHGSDGIKSTIALINKISRRFGGVPSGISIAYDAGEETQGVSWPIKWYLRDFSDVQSFNSVENTLQSADIIIADPQTFALLSDLVDQTHFQATTLRMVWPNQDYFDLISLKLLDGFSDPFLRNALYQIWYNADYTLYSTYYNKDGFDITNWYPSDKMKIYINREKAEGYWELYIDTR